MSESRLWYVRRATGRRGPFPAALIEHDIALGRIRASDELSHDGEDWQSAATYPDFGLLVASGCEPRQQRRLDERERERRQAAASPDRDGRRSGGDRREPEAVEVTEHRARARRVWASLEPRRHPALRSVLGLALTLAVVVALGIKLGQPPARSASDCAAPPAPGVVWDFCQRPAAALAAADLRGASLRNASLVGAVLTGAALANADLGFADLTNASLREAAAPRARLTGAALRGADLAGADLTEADLEFADLTGAQLGGTVLTGARLANAIWTDGQLCGRGSRGGCLRESTAVRAAP